MTLSIEGLSGESEARIEVVDQGHGSALAVWEAMGSPDFPSREQQVTLRKAAELAPPEIRTLPAGSPATLSLTLAPQGLALIEVIKH